MMMGIVAGLILVVGIVFVAVLAAGGGGDDGGTGTPQGPDNDGEDRQADGSGFCDGRTLVTLGSDPASGFDPIQVRDTSSAEYAVEIYGGLVTLDLDLNVQPDIAESWDISPDHKTYTFTLRDNVVFHNGRRVTAEDVKYSLERAADPANNSPTASLYLGEIVGFRERFYGSGTELTGVTVIDERTIQIEIVEPAAFFLAELTYPVTYVVDRVQIENDPRGWTRAPNGTGPFKLKEFKPAERIVLTANDRYHLGAPLLDQVVFELAGGSAPVRYENDELHIVGVSEGQIDALLAGTSELAEQYRPASQMTITYIAFNIAEPPFDDIKVRQAFSMAIDFEQINEVLFFGSSRVADGILPPEMPGYTESVRSLGYDPELAQQLISESKYAGDMPRITLSFGGAAGDSPNILAVYQAAWSNVLGVDVQLEAVDFVAFLRDLRLKKFQFFAAGWAADYPDPEDFLDKLFQTDSEQNEQGYSNPEVDRLLLEARYESDSELRRSLYAEAEQLILDDAAIIPSFWAVDHLLVKPCVQGWEDLSMIVPRYRFIELTPVPPE